MRKEEKPPTQQQDLLTHNRMITASKRTGRHCRLGYCYGKTISIKIFYGISFSWTVLN